MPDSTVTQRPPTACPACGHAIFRGQDGTYACYLADGGCGILFTKDLKPTMIQALGAPKSKEEPIDHPAHYGGKDNPYEAIKIIEALGWGEGFNRGNALKYLIRAGKKGGPTDHADGVPKEVEDLRKAAWYLDREIARLGATRRKES